MLDAVSFYSPGDDNDLLTAIAILYRACVSAVTLAFTVYAWWLIHGRPTRGERSHHFGLFLLVLIAFLVVCVRSLALLGGNLYYFGGKDSTCEEDDSWLYNPAQLIYNMMRLVELIFQLLTLWHILDMRNDDPQWPARKTVRAILLLLVLEAFSKWFISSFLEVQSEFRDCFEGILFQKSAWSIFDRLTFPFVIFYNYQTGILFLIAFFELRPPPPAN